MMLQYLQNVDRSQGHMFITTLSYINFKRNYCIEIAVHYLAITLSICGVIAWISSDLQVCIYFYLSQSSMMLGGLELFFAQKIPILSVKTVHKYISVTPATPILSLCYIYESLLLKESVSLQEQDVCWGLGISPETLKIIPNKYYFYFFRDPRVEKGKNSCRSPSVSPCMCW